MFSRLSSGSDGGDQPNSATDQRAQQERSLSSIRSVEKSTLYAGRTRLRTAIKAGAERLSVWSAEALFGDLVEQAKDDGKFVVRMVNPRKALTVQIGASLAVNVHSLLNNDLFVTPITVKEPAQAGAEVFFGSGVVALGEGGRIDMEALKATVQGLESVGVYGPEDSKYEDHQAEALRLEALSDELFWEGIQAERSSNTDRLIYCPLFDSEPTLEFVSKARYKEALRHLNRSVELDKTRVELYSKRAAVLCKLEWFERALPDAQTYTHMRPESPTGFCLEGSALHGLKQFGSAIAAYKKGLEVGEMAYWDRSRVWTVGTLLRRSMGISVRERDAVSKAGKVANAQGMTWCGIAEFNEALQRFREGVEATALALGTEHLSYATCLNNLAACQEAMGRYDEALKGYTLALKVTERSAPGLLNIVAVAGRHLPKPMQNGKLVDGQWIPEGMCCNPYIKMEHWLTRQMYKDEPDPPTVVSTRAILDTTQPHWSQYSSIPAESAFGEIRFTLMCQNPLQAALLKEISTARERISPVQQQAKAVEAVLAEIAAREARVLEMGKLKLSELDKLRADRAERLRDKEALEGEIKGIEAEVSELLRRAGEAQDVEIGSFMYDTRTLVDSLEGKSKVSFQEWFQTLDADGNKVRGEDFGVCAIEIELGWEVESSEYATRLCNIGNLHRIIGDTFTTRGGGMADLKKMDSHYALAQEFLDSALHTMIKTKSVVRTKNNSLLSLKEDKDLPSGGHTVHKVDGERTEEVCVVLENIAQLLVARSMRQTQPKGAPATQIAHFDSVQARSRDQALVTLEKAISIRRSLTGERTKEMLTLRSALTMLHVEMDNYQDALPLQEGIVDVAKDVYGDGSEEWTRQMGILNEIHKHLGTTFIRTGKHGSWTVDTQESWHWEMPSVLTRKVARAAAATHKRAQEDEEEFRSVEAAMALEKVRLFDPPKITDYKLKSDDDPLFKLAREAALKMEKEKMQPTHHTDIKRAVAVASKLKTPDTALVRQDQQVWPNRGIHTKTS